MANETDDLIDEGDSLMEDAYNDFLDAVKGIEVLLFAELMKIVNTLSVTNGKLATSVKSSEFLISLDKRIYTAMSKAEYNDTVQSYLKNFNKIADNARLIQESMNGVDIPKGALKPIINVEQQNTLSKLTTLDKDFIAPIREGIFRNLYLGADASSVEQVIRDFVVSTPDADSRLLRYVGQIAVDSIHQFDGSIQAKIGEELPDLNAIRYVGSLIKDSRGQCMKWVEQNHGIILVKNLQAEIDFAYDGSYHKKKCSGMIPGTTPANFVINRGGYRCRHRAIYTKV